MVPILVSVGACFLTAIALPSAEAMLSTFAPGVWLFDDDCLGESPPTAGSGISKAPVAVTTFLYWCAAIVIFSVNSNCCVNPIVREFFHRGFPFSRTAAYQD